MPHQNIGAYILSERRAVERAVDDATIDAAGGPSGRGGSPQGRVPTPDRRGATERSAGAAAIPESSRDLSRPISKRVRIRHAGRGVFATRTRPDGAAGNDSILDSRMCDLYFGGSHIRPLSARSGLPSRGGPSGPRSLRTRSKAALTLDPLARREPSLSSFDPRAEPVLAL